jgi:hypothetical protein
MVEDGRPIWTHLCPRHIFEIKGCLKAIASVRAEDKPPFIEIKDEVQTGE